MIKKITLSLAFSLLITGNTLASNGYFDARNDAMGGVGVASSLNNSALLANPALIAKTNQIILNVSPLGLQLSDKNHLLDEFEEIKSKVNKYESNCYTCPMDVRQQARELKSNLEAVKDKNIDLNIGLSTSLIIPHENNKVGFFLKVQRDVTMHTLIEDEDLRLFEMVDNDSVNSPYIPFTKY